MLSEGEGQIGSFYGSMDWEQTDTCLTAAIGFGDGQGNAVVIAGANTPRMNDVVGVALAGLAANRRRTKA